MKDLWKLVAGLSSPSKMPWYSFSISAKQCNVGSKLAKIKGTPCFSCYAFRGNYTWNVVKQAHAKRFRAIHRKDWAPNMISLLKQEAKKVPKQQRYFRFFDSGDIVDYEFLLKIVEVANDCKGIKFWLPTQERPLIQRYIKEFGKFPKNLTVRISSPLLGKATKAIPGTVTSNIGGSGYSCPAKEQGNKCLDCRKCWDKRYKTISYIYH